MPPKRVVPDFYASDTKTGAAYYTEVLGFEVAMEMDFITTYASPEDRNVQISVLAQDPSGLKPDYSVEVTDVDLCYRRAVDSDTTIVYPLTDEPWGVRRFFVKDPTGALANILSHRED